MLQRWQADGNIASDFSNPVFDCKISVPKANTKSFNQSLLKCGIVTIAFFLDMYVFIGARSDVGQAHWYWNNDTVATDTRLSSSSSSRCQQTAIKYQYLDSNCSRPWTFTAENCTGSQAYYVCEIKG